MDNPMIASKEYTYNRTSNNNSYNYSPIRYLRLNMVILNYLKLFSAHSVLCRMPV